MTISSTTAILTTKRHSKRVSKLERIGTCTKPMTGNMVSVAGIGDLRGPRNLHVFRPPKDFRLLELRFCELTLRQVVVLATRLLFSHISATRVVREFLSLPFTTIPMRWGQNRITKKTLNTSRLCVASIGNATLVPTLIAPSSAVALGFPWKRPLPENLKGSSGSIAAISRSQPWRYGVSTPPATPSPRPSPYPPPHRA